MKFNEFPKIGRLQRQMTITEKIDGTNASVNIVDVRTIEGTFDLSKPVVIIGSTLVFAGSRTRWVTPEDDNHGFAKWVKENVEELLELGMGHHFGEWWGSGIQCGYELKEKRFSLFNVGRWLAHDKVKTSTMKAVYPPACCNVVPTLYEGPFDTNDIDTVFESLRNSGSIAAPGFMKPEGIIVYHSGNNSLFKRTFEKDAGKWN